MNPTKLGFVLRPLFAPGSALKIKNVALRDPSSLQKFFSTSGPSQGPFRQLMTCNGRFGLGSPTMVAFGAGVVGLGCYTYYRKRNANKIERATAIDSNLRVEIPDAKPTRRIRGANDSNAGGRLKLTLYQYQSCPFCCKVRAYLDFRGLSYDVVEVNSVTQKEMKWSSYKKVPILVCEADGEKFQLNDSSAIISCLETFFEVGGSPLKRVVEFYPSFETTDKRGKRVMEIPNKYHVMFGDEESTFEREEIQKWREWTDKVFVHAISPNIYRTPSEALNTFKCFSKVGEWEESFSWFERQVIVYVGAAAMFFVSKILKKRHNLSDDVRESLYSACNAWMDHIRSGKGSRFAGGQEPDLSDLSVYGVFCAMEGTEAFQDVMAHTKIGDWFQAVKHEVNSRAGKRVPVEVDGIEKVATEKALV